MKVRVSRSAEQDLSSGFEFYETQAEGLGSYFLESLLAEIEALRFYAGVHRKTQGYHRCPAKRFPFVIYYFVADETVRIRAILDSRREPEWIRRKLRDLS